eukprot:Rhum_TRINITY_DN15092_c30_g1::Rhum_TRINITY_DN15092_c30_g1_i1::g.137920::m.137920
MIPRSRSEVDGVRCGGVVWEDNYTADGTEGISRLGGQRLERVLNRLLFQAQVLVLGESFRGRGEDGACQRHLQGRHTLDVVHNLVQPQSEQREGARDTGSLLLLVDQQRRSLASLLYVMLVEQRVQNVHHRSLRLLHVPALRQLVHPLFAAREILRRQHDARLNRVVAAGQRDDVEEGRVNEVRPPRARRVEYRARHDARRVRRPRHLRQPVALLHHAAHGVERLRVEAAQRAAAVHAAVVPLPHERRARAHRLRGQPRDRRVSVGAGAPRDHGGVLEHAVDAAARGVRVEGDGLQELLVEPGRGRVPVAAVGERVDLGAAGSRVDAVVVGDVAGRGRRWTHHEDDDALALCVA